MATTNSADTAESARPDPSDGQVSREAVRARLDRVYDPELDRSIVDLQYVEEIDIDGGDVAVTFVLPTAWCSPAFAWMMATGIRDEVGELPDVESVTVRLADHMHGDEITDGVNREQPFEAVFEDADDGIDAVRSKLDRTARFARQHGAVRALQEAGLEAEQIADLTRADVDLEFAPDRAAVSVRDGDLTVTAPKEPLAEYLQKARATGLVTDGADRVFADRDGDPLEPDPEAVEDAVRDARLAAANVEGQATICASLHESRNGASFE